MVYIVSSNRVEDSSNNKIKNKNNQSLNDKNLYNSLKFFMVLAHILGLFPIDCSAKSYTELTFKWKSLRVFHSVLMISLTSFAVLSCLINWFVHGYKFADVGTYVFYIGSLLILLLHLRLSTRWPTLINTWCEMDKTMNIRYGYPSSLDRRLKIYSTTFLSLAIVDYFLSIYNRYVRLTNVHGDSYEYKIYFMDTFHQLYMIVPVNIITALYCMFVSTHSTVLSAFNDLFIMLMSISLALRFKQITQKLEENFMKFQLKNDDFWIEIREDYDRLSILCKDLDDNISYIILLSYTHNLFFLLMQLYESLLVVSGLTGKVYFLFSFVYIIFKIVCVSLYAAWINDESIGPANILNSVSSTCYNIEVKRLLTQISFDNVALTGCRMFQITRGIILSIAGAVVTYELVLIQFNSATNSASEN